MEGHIQGFRTSPQQSRVWRLQQDGLTSCSSLCLLHVEGDLDRTALRRALAETVARHGILRTAFRLPAGLSVPLQVILPPGLVSLPEVDFRDLYPEHRAAGMADLLSALGSPPLDLERGEGWRAVLVRMGPCEHGMLLALSAACADAGTFEPLAADLFSAYARQVTGQVTDPEPPLQYADVATWQNSLLEEEDTAAAVEAWREHWRKKDIGTRIALPLPLEELEPAPHSFAPRDADVPLARGAAAALARLADLWDCPLPVLLLTAWKAVIQRSTGRDETLVGVLYTGRGVEELRSVVGPLARYLPVAADFEPAAPLREAADRVREAMAEAERRGEYFSWDHVAGSGTDGFPVCFEATPQEWELAVDGLRVASVHLAGNSAILDRFSLSLSCREEGEELRLALRYDPRRFRPQAAHHLAGRLAALLGSIAARPEAPLADHPAMAERELSRWLELSLAPPAADRGREGETLHAVFEEQADRTPDRLAVAAGDGRLTFRDLDLRANRLAHHLRAAGAGPEVPVALCLERSAEAVVALLATWKAGAAYVPLDPTQPAERLAYLLKDTGAPLLVTDSQLASGLPGAGHLPGVHTVRLDEEAAAIALLPAGRPAGGAEPRSLAYVIYTSGSTGQPKGVQVEHRSALHLLAALETAVLDPLALSEPLLASLNAPMIFDASVQQLALLLAGHALCVVPQDIRADGAALLAFLREQEVELLDCTPSQLRLLVNAGLLDGPDGPRIVLAAGETMDESLWRRLAQARRLVCFNLYGPTECSVDATIHRIEPGSTKPTIGRPLAGYEVFLLDRFLQPAPPGAPGELCLGGPGLARGYLRRPDLTAERFLPHPFARRPGDRLYHTGDLGCRLPDGDLEFLGRLDHQVKIRGFRIELGEIEAALLELDGVREAVVVAHGGATGDLRLVAYVAGGITIDALRQGLRKWLPDYMMPAIFVMLAALPLTTNGKLDRKALPAPEWHGNEEDYLAPRTPVEEILAGIWAELLGLQRAGAADHFFDLGGQSLLATRAMSRVRAAFGIDLPLRTLFEAPTVEGLAAAVERVLRADVPPLPPLTAVPRDGDLPLSFAQQRLWFLDQLLPGNPAYSLPSALRIIGALDPQALAESFRVVSARHEVLRATFGVRNGEPVQRVAPPAAVSVPLHDLTGLPRDRAEAEVHRLATESARRPFNLARGPLLRVTLVQLGDREHALLLNLHHIVGDGWSTGVLIRELTALYASFVRGATALLPELPVQYADYAIWQREWLQGETLDAQLAWWRRELAGASTSLDLPFDRPRPAVSGPRGSSVALAFSAELTARLEALSRRNEATLFMTLLAGWSGLLSRYAAQDDVLVGSPIANRTRLETENLIGFFVNTLVLRTDLSGGPELAELVARVRRATLGAYDHQDLPFERLVEELAPERSINRSPLFQVMFGLQNAPVATIEMTGLELRPLWFEIGTAKFDLNLSLTEGSSGLHAVLEYDTDLFDRTTVERLLRRFEILLGFAVSDPAQPFKQLPLLSDEERHQMLVVWNRTSALEMPARTAHESIAAFAAEHPEAPAIFHGDAVLSYGELVERADCLAARLRRRGAGQGMLIGLCLERSPDLIVGLLGILKAGAGYVPLDPSYPAERLAFILADTGVPLLVTRLGLTAALPLQGVEPVCVDEPEDPGDSSLPPAVPLEAPAYVIYTSGSTGRPKGVVISHLSLAHFARETAQDYGLRPSDRVLQFRSVSFDASVEEIYPTLLVGATLVLSPERPISPAEMLALGHEQRISVLNLPTAYWHAMAAELEGSGALPETVRLVVFGGEEALPRALSVWRSRISPGVRLVNAYGPTEGTVSATRWEVSDGVLPGRIPIGRPVTNVQAYVLDTDLEPVPVETPGELFLAGAGLAHGYLGRPDATADRFVPNPFAPEPGGRLYRTGDLVRYRSNSLLEFLGRVDHQVKIRGHRVELSEVEGALCSHPSVAQAVVAVWESAPEDRRLAAWVVPIQGAELNPTELRAHLRATLPEPILPSAWSMLSSLPLNQSGKVDRRALPRPDRLAVTAVVSEEPQTAIERQVAEIWSDLLGTDLIGLHDNFFDLGGHSLLMMRVQSRLRDQLGREVTMVDLFSHTTVSSLARLLADAEGTNPAPVRRAGQKERLAGGKERLRRLRHSAPVERGAR